MDRTQKSKKGGKKMQDDKKVAVVILSKTDFTVNEPFLLLGVKQAELSVLKSEGYVIQLVSEIAWNTHENYKNEIIQQLNKCFNDQDFNDSSYKVNIKKQQKYKKSFGDERRREEQDKMLLVQTKQLLYQGENKPIIRKGATDTVRKSRKVFNVQKTFKNQIQTSDARSVHAQEQELEGSGFEMSDEEKLQKQDAILYFDKLKKQRKKVKRGYIKVRKKQPDERDSYVRFNPLVNE
eukprot:TRINITY_DN9594_c0_g2_i1.p1 TRINITY_DN9594_c0_g2~~TRINITY_DN9594_c0_g2_i1.p1  ORF type:complete len:236 (+),score=35.34 TRINITY_DN9594_c0_g2_i1:40-747(+)